MVIYLLFITRWLFIYCFWFIVPGAPEGSTGSLIFDVMHVIKLATPDLQCDLTTAPRRLFDLTLVCRVNYGYIIILILIVLYLMDSHICNN